MESRSCKYLQLTVGVALIAMIILLSLQNSRLRSSLDENMRKVSLPWNGMYVPEVQRTLSDGRIAHLGRPMHRYQILFFFNTRCPYCRQSMPAITLLNDHINSAGRGTELMLVSQDGASSTKKYLDEVNLALPFAQMQETRIQSLFHATIVPSIAVIDESGVVRYAFSGLINDKDDIAAVINALDKMESVDASATSKAGES